MISFIALAAALPAVPATDVTDAEDVVVVATGAEQDRAATGQAVTVVTRAELEQRQTVSIADHLATTPGVTVSRNGGPGGFTGVRIRGAEGEQTLVLIDGVRVNDPSSPGGGFDFGNLLSGAVERVEVLRGANSVAWGSQAIGGVINVVTERPVAGLTARARAEYGYHDTGYASAALAAGSEKVRGSVTGGAYGSDGISTAAIGVERDGYRQFGGTAKLVIEPVAGFGADLRLYYADSKLELDGFPAPTYATFTDTREYSKAKELYGHAGLFANFADGRIRNRIGFTLADINRDNFDRAAGSAPIFQARGRSERYEYRGDFVISDAFRFVGGVEHEDSRFDDLAGTKADTGITSIHGQAIVRPLARLTLTGGLRHDDHQDFGNKTSLGGSAALTVGRGTTLRASYAEGFKAPTLFQLFSFFGTPTLRPERAKGWDVGVEQVAGRGTFSVTWFQRRTRNQIDFDLGTFDYRNIDRTRAQGVEAAAELRPSDALTVALTYSHIAGRDRSPGANFGNQLARRPRDTASVAADWRSPWGVALGGTVRLFADSFDDPGNFTRLDGYALTDIRAEIGFADRFALYGRVENLFDAGYRTVAGYGNFGRAAFVGVRAKLK